MAANDDRHDRRVESTSRDEREPSGFGTAGVVGAGAACAVCCGPAVIGALGAAGAGLLGGVVAGGAALTAAILLRSRGSRCAKADVVDADRRD
jgi:hypothetical protein